MPESNPQLLLELSHGLLAKLEEHMSALPEVS